MKKWIGVIALLAMTAACSGAQPDIVGIRPVNEQVVGASQDALARAELLFSRGEHALALDAYRRAVRNDPKDARALNGVAISYAAMGRHDLARQFFELALARAPQDGRIYRNFARSLRAQGMGREADALLAQADPAARYAMMRPTLAQIAASGETRVAAVRISGPELERLSLGEVRLRTSMADNSTLGKRAPQLSTAIVTVSDRGGLAQAPATELARTLSAPIVRVDEKPRVVAQGEEKPKNVSRKASSVRADEDASDGLFQRLWQEWRGTSLG